MSLICQLTSEDIKHHFISIIIISAENTVDHVEAFQAVGGASSDNKQRGCSHYQQATATHVSVTRTVVDSRNEQFDAATERVKTKTMRGTGLDTETALSTTSSTTQSMYSTQTAFLSSTTATMETLTFQAGQTSQTVKRTLQRTTGVLTVGTSPCRALTVFFVI